MSIFIFSDPFLSYSYIEYTSISFVLRVVTLVKFLIISSHLRMANAAGTCLFFLLMLLSYNILCVEGRSLELKKALKHAKRCNPGGKSNIERNTILNSASPSNHLHHTVKTSDGFVEAFRPTNPGHSPGVGHSIHN